MPLTIMFAAAFAAFIATFNETFLNVGFTTIMADFEIGVSTVQWLATAYMLGAAVMTPTAGFFIRRFSTKPLFLATASTWIIGGIITALAPSFAVLLIGRIIQSVGTGLLVPSGMMIALTVAPRPKLGTFMGLMGAMTTLGPSVAILASGMILEFSSWRALEANGEQRKARLQVLAKLRDPQTADEEGRYPHSPSSSSKLPASSHGHGRWPRAAQTPPSTARTSASTPTCATSC